MVLLLKSGAKLSSLCLQMRGGRIPDALVLAHTWRFLGFCLVEEEGGFFYWVVDYHFPYGNYYCQDTEEVQSTQGDSHDGFEIHICKLIPLRKESGQG